MRKVFKFEFFMEQQSQNFEFGELDKSLEQVNIKVLSAACVFLTQW